MSPDGGGEPSGALAKAIEDTFESLGELKREMKDAGRRGSGAVGRGSPDDGTSLVVKSPPIRTRLSSTATRLSSASTSGSTRIT